MKKATENWLKIAKYDLKVAGDNYKDANYIASVEKCHNALEKLLKGIITENNAEPKKIHDLLRLTSEALIEDLQKETKDLFEELNNVYINTRYPDEFDLLCSELGEEQTKLILEKTKGVFKWLEKKII